MLPQLVRFHYDTHLDTLALSGLPLHHDCWLRRVDLVQSAQGIAVNPFAVPHW